MKGSLFCGLRNRTTEGGRPGKPRNTKENRHMEGFNTASRLPVALRSSANDNRNYRRDNWDYPRVNSRYSRYTYYSTKDKSRKFRLPGFFIFHQSDIINLTSAHKGQHASTESNMLRIRKFSSSQSYIIRFLELNSPNELYKFIKDTVVVSLQTI